MAVDVCELARCLYLQTILLLARQDAGIRSGNHSGRRRRRGHFLDDHAFSELSVRDNISCSGRCLVSTQHGLHGTFTKIFTTSQHWRSSPEGTAGSSKAATPWTRLRSANNSFETLQIEMEAVERTTLFVRRFSQTKALPIRSDDQL